jgi:hypothetical protein
MPISKPTVFRYPEVGVPFLWPFSFFMGLEEAEIEEVRKSLKFLSEIEKTQVEKPTPEWTTVNTVEIELRTLRLRNFSRPGKGTLTTSGDIVEDLAEGGHIGLLMGKKAIQENWFRIANWIRQHTSSGKA